MFRGSFDVAQALLPMLGVRTADSDDDRRAPKDRKYETHRRGTALHQVRSNIPAAPMPPPMHMVTMPYRAFLRCKSRISVAVSFAPVQPSGWPSAIAPPLRS